MNEKINEIKLFVGKKYEFDKKIFMKKIIYSIMLLKIVAETIFIHLNINLFIILTLQIFLKTKKLIS